MAITYNAGTNLITLDDSAGAGDSWGTAYDMEDVLAACGAVVTKQGANAYDVSARMLFVSGVYFVSKSEFVELKPNPTNPVYVFRIDSGAHVQFGEYNSSDKFSYNGAFWRIYTNATTGGNSGNTVSGEFLVYGSSIWTDSGNYPKGIHLKAGATVRYYNSLLKYAGYFWATDCDLQDVKWFGGGGSYDMLVACGIQHNWAGLTTMDCQKGVFFSATTTGNVDVYDATILNAGTDIYISTGISASWLVRIINSPTAVTCNTPGSGKRGVQFCYTFNVKVTNDQGSPIVGATVELKDVDGTIVFSEQTIAGGVLTADKIVKWYWFRHANDGGNKDYNDHTLKITNGADETEYKIKIDHQITEDVVLLPQSVASYDNIMAGINDMKGTGFVKDTHSLPQALTAIGFATENPPSQNLGDYKAVGFATENPPSQVLADYMATGFSVHDADDVKIAMEAAGSKLDRVYENVIIRSGTVSAVISQFLEFTTNLGEGTDNYWTRGAIRWTSGNNEGAIRKIQIYSAGSGYVKLRTEVVNDIQAGDTFDIISIRAFRINHEDVEQVVDEVWNEVITAHTNVGSFGEKNQHQVPSETIDDYKATGFSVPNEYDTAIGNIQSEVDGLNGEAMRGTNNAYAGTPPTTGEIAEAVQDEVVEGTLTLRHLLRVFLSVLAGKSAGGGTDTVAYRDNADSKNRVTGTVDDVGNRTDVIIDGE